MGSLDFKFWEVEGLRVRTVIGRGAPRVWQVRRERARVERRVERCIFLIWVIGTFGEIEGCELLL